MREAVLEAVRFTERVCTGLFEVLGEEVKDDESKRNVSHFMRGTRFVLRQLREKR
jgi:hypothetical protein